MGVRFCLLARLVGGGFEYTSPPPLAEPPLKGKPRYGLRQDVLFLSEILPFGKVIFSGKVIFAYGK